MHHKIITIMVVSCVFDVVAFAECFKIYLLCRLRNSEGIKV